LRKRMLTRGFGWALPLSAGFWAALVWATLG
jgi:hypothetical protein